mmetsp:Transcript_19452/g.32498  ORF Transcript_19452/g.32498 Transcript_19452/m.32498 type:complete len:776 (+) Transcript_19452:136-2463(+)
MLKLELLSENELVIKDCQVFGDCPIPSLETCDGIIPLKVSIQDQRGGSKLRRVTSSDDDTCIFVPTKNNFRVVNGDMLCLTFQKAKDCKLIPGEETSNVKTIVLKIDFTPEVAIVITNDPVEQLNNDLIVPRDKKSIPVYWERGCKVVKTIDLCDHEVIMTGSVKLGDEEIAVKCTLSDIKIPKARGKRGKGKRDMAGGIVKSRQERSNYRLNFRKRDPVYLAPRSDAIGHVVQEWKDELFAEGREARNRAVYAENIRISSKTIAVPDSLGDCRVGTRFICVRVDQPTTIKGNRTRLGAVVKRHGKLHVSAFKPTRDEGCYNMEEDCSNTALAYQTNGVTRWFNQDFEACMFPETREDDLSVENVVSRKAGLNSKQKEAVNRIVSNKAPPVFIVFGPPGTGKTTTIAHSILLKATRLGKSEKILVCAQTNAACSVVIDKLSKGSTVESSKILRIMSRSYFESGQATELELECHRHSFENAKVVVTTINMAARINWDCVFARVFVDEASQCTEPEVMQLCHLFSKRTRVVLSGDIYQLGPVVLSTKRSPKLCRSLMERVMLENALYDPELERPSHLVMLCESYRFAHEALIETPNRQYYSGKITVNGNTSSSKAYSFLPDNKVPLSIYDVPSERMRVHGSLSLVNIAEIHIVQAAINDVTREFPDYTIGVITPYQMQERYLRKQISDSTVKVGVVEKFQGGECDCIIVSVTQSKAKADDFLFNEKRYNVATTRAKKLMIIIGCLKVLQSRPGWKDLAAYCASNSLIKTFDDCRRSE